MAVHPLARRWNTNRRLSVGPNNAALVRRVHGHSMPNRNFEAVLAKLARRGC
jgi:hypothetical protein